MSTNALATTPCTRCGFAVYLFFLTREEFDVFRVNLESDQQLMFSFSLKPSETTVVNILDILAVLP